MFLSNKNGQLLLKGVAALFLLVVLLGPACLGLNAAEKPKTGEVVNSATDLLDQAAKSGKAVAEGVTTPPTTAQIIGRIIVIGLQIIGLVFFVLIVYGGIVWLTAGGNKERADKATSTLRQATLGLLVIIFAYLLVNFVVLRLAGIATTA